MRRPLYLLVLLLAWSCLPVLAQIEKGQERRLLRIESRVYGWYGLAEPSFDRTIGRRQLYKITGANDFLKGLEGRLVVLEGKFSEGTLQLGQFAPPPVTVPDGAWRQRFELPANSLTSADGYRLLSDDPRLQRGDGSRSVDLVVTGAGPNSLQVLDLLALSDGPAQAQAPSSATVPAASPALGGGILELELSQGFLDAAVDLGRDQTGRQVTYQAVSLALSHLRVLLPETEQGPWRLEGTVELGLAGQGALAESSFVISARPLVEGNVLYLEPNWDEIKLEGQLPFAFVLTPAVLSQVKAYLPRRLPALDLDWISSYLRSQGLLTEQEQPLWYLGRSTPGSVVLGLGEMGSSSQPSRPLHPDTFRLQLSSSMADRLVRRGVATFLDPEEPFVPNPPIPVGQALFVSIKVEKVFLRSLQSGYSNGVFRFQDLVVDVGWRAGPLNGTEPLLSTNGFVRPRLTPAGSDGLRKWDWDVKIEELTLRSDKLPGNKEQLARELIPRLERELGTALAQKQNLPARLPLSVLVKTPAMENASIILTELRPLDQSLEIEGKLSR